MTNPLPTYDDTAAIRRAMLPHMPSDYHDAVANGDPIWDTAALKRDFDVTGFAAPFVVVRRKSDGAVGTLKFTHSPRFYFGWAADA